MPGSYWDDVRATGLAVPSDRPLGDLTAELTTMLGDPDPDVRDGIAYPMLATWIERGVYDDLLPGLGDGMAGGLTVGLGSSGDDTVFRRSFSVLVLAECVGRDTQRALVTREQVLDWGDRIATWLLRERDLRGYVPGQGWAHAVAHGADALGRLAASPHFGKPELTVVLDVIADRLLARTDALFTAREPDRLALATMTVLRRGIVPLSIVEPWVNRIAAAAASRPRSGDPYLASGNAEAFLRALHLQLQLAAEPPAVRSDLLLVLVDALRRSNAGYLAAPQP